VVYAGAPGELPKPVSEPIASQFRAFREAAKAHRRRKDLWFDVRDEAGEVVWQSYSSKPLPPAPPDTPA
jgi:hypothetical protein